MTSCAICGALKSNRESDPHGMFGYHEFTPGQEFVADVAPQPTAQELLRDAAFRAAVWGVIAAAAKDRQDEAKAELSQLEPGDAIAGKWDGQTIAKASMSKGRSKLVVTDELAFVNWVAGRHPTEIVSQVNPAFVKSLEARAKDIGLGAVVSSDGEVVPGVEIVEGTPYVSVRREKDAPFIVAQLLSSGRIQLDGIKELGASNGDQVA